MRATQHFHNRLAVMFDFDETLAPSSYDALLESLDLDTRSFRDEQIQPLVDDGWDKFLAECHCVIQEARRRDDVTLTREHLAQVGSEIDLFDGVPGMFDTLREQATEVIPDVEVEFYLLSCGLLDIQKGLPIADEFETMWGSELYFDDDGEAAFVKQVITFPEKVRYVQQMAKGLDGSGAGPAADVFHDVAEEDLHVPMDQIVYVGDGSSDIPVFTLLHDRGGMALGVVKADEVEEWEGYDEMASERKIQNLALADYTDGSELLQSLQLSVDSICRKIALRRLSQGQ